jgi:hypothetical protein
MAETPKPPRIDLSRCSEQERTLAEQFVRILRRLERSRSKQITLTLKRKEQSLWLSAAEGDRLFFQMSVDDGPVTATSYDCGSKPRAGGDPLGSITTHTYDGTGGLVCCSYLGGTITTTTYDYPTTPPRDKDQRGEDDSPPGPAQEDQGKQRTSTQGRRRTGEEVDMAAGP